MHDAGTHGALSPEMVQAAVDVVSEQGTFRYTLRHLYYELVRLGTWSPPGNDPAAELQAFGEALHALEKQQGQLEGRIRHADLLPEPELSEIPPDIVDYTVRRVIVFDRAPPFLTFALNGFHRKIEVGLVLWPRYPRHFWETIERYLAEGPGTTFYVLHDCNRAGYALEGKVRKAVKKFGPLVNVVDVGLQFQQAFNRGMFVRTRPGDDGGEDAAAEPEGPGDLLEGGTAGDLEEAAILLQSGNFAHVEEMRPLAMMRWAYGKVARRHQDVGFG